MGYNPTEYRKRPQGRKGAVPVKEDTRRAKKTKEQMLEVWGNGKQEKLVNQVMGVMDKGRQVFDACLMEMGKMMAEAVMYIEREEIAGPDYHPSDYELKKWASQPGAIYLGGQKIRLRHPRLRGKEGEIILKTYQALKDRNRFGQDVLAKILSGMSGRKYCETLGEFANQVGVRPSSISRHIVEVTAQKLKEFRERDLSAFKPFALFLDGINRGGATFIVALGLDIKGNKQVLGFWEGATENHDICQELLSDIKRRGLELHNGILYITDGGGGIIKALRELYGKWLLHQRCTNHKDRNIQKHLPKKYRKEAHRRFRDALDLTDYEDAKQALLEFEKWLRAINESSANSLKDTIEELLTLHRLKIPPKFRKTLHTTNPIESMFSTVRHTEKNIKRYSDSNMSQRWLATVLLYAEKHFRKVNEYRMIQDVIESIKKVHEKVAKAA